MAREAVNRPRRAPVDGYRSKLAVRGKDPNYEYYIATDKDGRIEALHIVTGKQIGRAHV